ncbi:unnamed protein product [Rotaria sp. Silwood1]|nr:unnamed protein product [Rotaria sp. Silwood1]
MARAISHSTKFNRTYMIFISKDAPIGHKQIIDTYDLSFCFIFSMNTTYSHHHNLPFEILLIPNQNCTLYLHVIHLLNHKHTSMYTVKQVLIYENISNIIHLSINIIDVNDRILQFENKHYHFIVQENILPGTFIGRVQVYNAQIVFNDNIFYILFGNDLIQSNNQIMFRIDKDTGDIFLFDYELDYEIKQEYKIMVEAKGYYEDFETGIWTSISSFADIIITVEDINDEKPQIIFYMPDENKNENNEKIMSITKPIDSLAFATESCFGSLANCLGFYDNVTLPIPKEFEDYKLYDVEIRYGIIQLCDGLAFLHNEVKLFHRNLCPESIIINSNGAWKLSGFELCIQGSVDGEAAVFVLEKRLLDKYAKKDLLKFYVLGVQQLAKIKHPRILSLQHPLEESRDSLAFATESCFGSLANCLGFYDNVTLPIPKEFEDYKLYDVEIRYGIIQLCDGLAFLHNEVKLFHRNLCPESIIINSNGAWKLSGFELCIQGSVDGVTYPFREYDGNIPPIINPRLDYMAPEYHTIKSYDTQSDMFSLGMLIYALYNHGKTLHECHDNYSLFIKMCDDLKALNTTKLSILPLEVRDHVKMLLSLKPELRPDAGQFTKIPFFEDVGTKTLEYLDSLFQVDNLQRSMFYKSLPQVIDKLPMRVNLQRIASALELEFINPEMVPFVLPNMFLIAEKANNEEYQKYLFPKLKQVFKIQKPPQGSGTSGCIMQTLLILMRNMNLMLTKTPPEDIKQHILPVVYNALDAESSQVQELCLAIIPSFAHLIDLQAMKYCILPRIKKICFETITLSVRVNCLICLGKLVESLDKWIIIDEVIPLLQSIPSREPAVLMAILGIIKVAMSSSKSGGLPREILATRVIPFLVPISIETSLNLNQFNAYISTIKDMLQTVEIEQRKKLEQLSQQAANSPIVPIGPSTTDTHFDQKSSSMIDQFMLGHGFNSEIAQNKTMAASFDTNVTFENSKPQQISSNQSTISENSLGKKTLTLEEKERMMRENDQTQRMKSQGELIPERKTPISSSSNIPLMAMTPISSSSAATATSNSSSAYFKDLTSTLFEQNPSQPSYGMSTSQTMPSLIRPTINNSPSTMSQQPKRPTLIFSSPSSSLSSNTTDLTSSLMNNINSLASRQQISPTTMSLNSMSSNTNSLMSPSHNNPGTPSGSMKLFQPPPSSGSIVVKGTNVTSSKTAAAEIDDLFK